MILFFRRYLYEWLLEEPGFSEPLSPDLLLILISLAAAVAMALVGVAIARVKPNFRRYDPDEYDQRFNGIGGTLLVTAAVVAILPLMLGAEIIVDRFLWTEQGRMVIGRAGPSAGFWLGFNAAAAGIRIAYALLLAWLFFKRKRVFRIAAIGYLLLSIVIFFVHDLLLSQTFAQKSMIVFENFSQVTRSLQIAILATPYLLFARRVQATLRK